jgi:pyruvate/2-oxoglutarate dehydrogenase complex dihydrolipoamide acyltransferase (E2) component
MSTVPVNMPKLGMAAVDATFLEWLVENGAHVELDQPLYMVATDKVDSEVTSPATGILRYGDAQAEVVYDVGAQLGVIEVSD